MYACGPTVYALSHLGHARMAVVWDVAQRYLRFTGYDVIYVRNITDVDDKINAAAAENREPIGALTARTEKAYLEDVGALGVGTPDVQPRVTEHIPEIVGMIERLIASGHAYAAENHVLFSVASYADYGKLSGRSVEEMIAGARIDVAPYKRDPADFVLWKPSKANEPEWMSPWGSGRPGWHIECSAMIDQVLGLPIDIHGGGIDLVFPHHENELAQGCCADHVDTYARFWMHNGFLNMAEEKMSKSLGNVALAHELLKSYPGEAIRWALLAGHYRAPLEWTGELIGQAKRSLDRLYGAVADSLRFNPAVAELEVDDAVRTALEDDLNTPAAMAALFMLADEVRAAILKKDARGAALARGKLLGSAGLMGFLAEDPQLWFQGGVDEALKAQIEELIAARAAARAAKDWPEADRIRVQLTELNVEVMDGPTGATWRLKEQV